MQILIIIVLVLLAIGLISKIVEVLGNVFKFIIGAALIIGIIALAINFYPLVLSIIGLVIIYNWYERNKTKRMVKSWYNQAPSRFTLQAIDNIIVRLVENISDHDNNNENYKFDVYNLPYGRINAFLNYFGKSIYDDEIFYYSAIQSMNPNEIREYGTAITRSGIYISKQYRTDDVDNPYKVVDKIIPFERLYGANSSDSQLIYSIVDLKNKSFNKTVLDNNITTIRTDRMSQLCKRIIELKIPLQYAKNIVLDETIINDSIDEADKKMQQKATLKGIENISTVAGVMGAQENIHNAYDENKNYMNGARGGGYAAEYGNNTVDRFFGKNVVNEAQNLDSETGRQVKNGADRIVNGDKIQTKYYQSAPESIGAAFEHKQSLYNDNGTMMQIEVPRDQYPEALKLMKKRIDSGQVEGAKPGDDPRKYVRKGAFTYAQANNIAIAGSVESLTVDVMNGAIICTQAGGISAVIAFSMAIWRGQSIEEAAQTGISTGIRVLGKGTFIYTLTMQLSRDKLINPFAGKILTSKGAVQSAAYVSNPIFAASEHIAVTISNSAIASSSMGKAMGLDKITGKSVVSGGVTAVVVFGPDICRALTGRISGKQLFKNSLIGASGIGGSIIGQTLIPIPVVGAIIGGMISGFVAKQTLDGFIEDDSKLMFQILKEEFLDVVMVSNLNQGEFDQVVSMTIAHPKISSLLMDMYASNEYREFARKAIVTAAVTNCIAGRINITDQSIYEGYELLLESA